MKCQIHPHSSIESAIECGNKRAGKRADRILERFDLLKIPKYKQIKFEEPKVVQLNNVKIYYFYGV